MWSVLYSIQREREKDLILLFRVKEAFGQFYSIYLNSLLFPEDRWMDTFVVDFLQIALSYDANPNIRSMTYPAETPSELENLFDVVAYDKGESFQILNVVYWKQNVMYIEFSQLLALSG